MKFSRTHLLVFAVSLAAIGSLLAWSALADDLTITNQTWQCNGNVNHDLVKITVNTGSDRRDGAHLNCSGRIGRLEIDNWSGDGIKIHQGAINLVVESGYVRLHDCPDAVVHMDGIQAMGGGPVTFRNFLVDATDLGSQGCGANSALFINQGAGGNSMPTDIVFENSTFRKIEDRNRTVRIGNSIRSGIRNSTVYWCGDSSNCGAGNAVWFGVNPVDPINQNTTIRLYSDSPSPPPPPIPPPPPSPTPTAALSASPSSINPGSSSTLSWSSTNASSCNASGAWTGSRATSGSQAVSPTVTSVYNLSCSGAGGTAAATATVTVSTPPPTDTIPPTAAINAPLAGATVSGTTTITAVASDNVAVSRVEFYIDGSLKGNDTASPYSYAWDTNGVSNGSHSIMARAYDAAGNRGSNQISVNVANADTTPPSTPTNLSASANAHNRISLSWGASTDNVGVAGYHIVRYGTTIATTSGTSYSDTTVVGSTTYTYQVIAYDARGNNSALSSAISATTPSTPDTLPPNTPLNLAARAVSASQINLSWSAAADNVGVVAYDVYSSVGTAAATKVATVTTTSFGHAGLTASTSYSYYVQARDAAGNLSVPSLTASAITQQPPTPPPTSTGHLEGQITGNDGRNIGGRPTASITVSGRTKTYASTSQGFYYVPNLPADTYQVLYRAGASYENQTKKAKIVGSQTTTVDVVMQKK